MKLTIELTPEATAYVVVILEEKGEQLRSLAHQVTDSYLRDYLRGRAEECESIAKDLRIAIKR